MAALGVVKPMVTRGGNVPKEPGRWFKLSAYGTLKSANGKPKDAAKLNSIGAKQSVNGLSSSTRNGKRLTRSIYRESLMIYAVILPLFS